MEHKHKCLELLKQIVNTDTTPLANVRLAQLATQCAADAMALAAEFYANAVSVGDRDATAAAVVELQCARCAIYHASNMAGDVVFVSIPHDRGVDKMQAFFAAKSYFDVLANAESPHSVAILAMLYDDKVCDFLHKYVLSEAE